MSSSSTRTTRKEPKKQRPCSSSSSRESASTARKESQRRRRRRATANWAVSACWDCYSNARRRCRPTTWRRQAICCWRSSSSTSSSSSSSSTDLLNATDKRLSNFASSLSLPFEFNPIEGKIGNMADLRPLGPWHDHEVTVLHWMHHCLYDITGSDLGTVRLLKLLLSKLVTIIEQDLSHAGSFLGRFVEALHYYSALFDALGDGLGGDSWERHLVE